MTARRKPGGQGGASHSSEQAPADSRKNSEADEDQRAGDDAAQRGARRGMCKLGAVPGTAAQARREDDAQRHIELAVNHISYSRGNRHWKLKDLTQSDAGEDAEPHGKQD